MDVYEIREIARAYEKDDPIDWGALRIDEEDTYTLMAQSVCNDMGEESRERLLGMLTKMYVENLVISLHLFGMDKNN